MAVKMVVFWCSLVFFIVGSNAAGEFDVIYSPRSLSFSGSSRIPETLLKEVFSASLGLSVEEGAEWDGMTILDPFASPEAVVEIYVDGIPNLGETFGSKAHAFPLTVDEYEPDTFEAMQHRIQQRFGDIGRLVKVKLSDVNQISSGVFADTKVPKTLKLTLSHLKYSVEEDSAFLHELAGLKAIIDKVDSGIVSGDNIIDFYYFRFQSLHALSDFHGPNSLQVKEAKRLLGAAIDELSVAFQKAYDGSVLVACVATDVAHTRRTVRAAPVPPQSYRSLDVESKKRRKRDDTKEAPAPPATAPASPAPSEPAPPPAAPAAPSATPVKEPATTPGAPPAPTPTEEDNYSEDYSAVFNIILWFGVVFAFALVSIVYAIMDMDPGRDSIIYRMTSTRMKKDN